MAKFIQIFNLRFLFCIGRSLGQGTFGKVRLGTHLITGEKVAIKILEKDKIKDQSDVERVTREIHILKIVRHPNVIQLYEVRASSFTISFLNIFPNLTDHRNLPTTVLDHGVRERRRTLRLHRKTKTVIRRGGVPLHSADYLGRRIHP
jgi:serine/threonine protein kinase